MNRNIERLKKFKFKTSRRPIVIISSIVLTVLMLIGFVALFVLIVMSVFQGFWWIFLITTYVSANLLVTQSIWFSEFNKHSRWKWIWFIWLVPLIGALVYVIIGKIPVTRYSGIKKIRKIRSEKLDHEVKPSSKFYSPILDGSDVTLKRKGFVNSNFDIFHSTKKFEHLFSSLEKSKEFIHMEYYIFRQGELFYDLFEILSRKVKEGVEVRIIIDYAGSLTVSRGEIKKWREAGIDIRMFNPIRPPFISGYVNLRTHRKIIVIDGDIGFLGGMNVGDEYIGMSPKFGDWIDAHVRLEGEVVSTLSMNFLLDWKYATKEDLLNEEKYFKTKPVENKTDIIKVIEDGPDVEPNTFEEYFMTLTSNAKERVWITSPYVVLPRKMIKKLISLAATGVEIKIFVPGRYDKWLPYKVSSAYLKRLNDNKIQIYRTRNLFLHAKVALWDDQISMVGTSNMDFRSFYTNYELNAFVDSKKTNRKVTNYFKEIEKLSDQVKPKYNSHYPWNWVRDFIFWLMTPIL